MQECMKYAAECDVLHTLSYDIFLLNKLAPTITAVWPLVLVSLCIAKKEISGRNSRNYGQAEVSDINKTLSRSLQM